ncbi:hypothetical protein ACIBTV_27580 [Micromonospora sp. NPDC049366]|uniref:hypothetical protein n=1 Tax=Micromonospora sp. NPDC049366 TaxID=3364271 RepID=UPI0037969865
MSNADATAFAIVGRYVRDFAARATQLNSYKIGGEWWKMRVPAEVAAEWADLGYLPEEAAPLITSGITPAMVRDAEGPTTVTAVAVLRQMYASNLARFGGARFELIREVHNAAALLLGLVGDTSDEAFDKIAPVGERVVDLLYAAAGLVNTGSDETPAHLSTVGWARGVIADLVDVSDIQVVGPVSDRRLAALIETTPDAD